MKRTMVVSESKGRLETFSWDRENGLTLGVEIYPESTYGELRLYNFPWNKNLPTERLNIETLRGKRAKITMELIDEEEQ